MVEADDLQILVADCDGTLLAIENRCTHEDAALGQGRFDACRCTVECPRHGSVFDLRTGAALTLPAYRPVETFPVSIQDGVVRVDLD